MLDPTVPVQTQELTYTKQTVLLSTGGAWIESGFEQISEGDAILIGRLRQVGEYFLGSPPEDLVLGAFGDLCADDVTRSDLRKSAYAFDVGKHGAYRCKFWLVFLVRAVAAIDRQPYGVVPV